MENVFRRSIAEARDRGVTVLLSSHILAETEALCRRVTIIRAGRTGGDGDAGVDAASVAHHDQGGTHGNPGDVGRIPGVEDVRVVDGVLHAAVDSASLPDFMWALSRAGVRSLVSQPPTLEELFLRHYDLGAPTQS